MVGQNYTVFLKTETFSSYLITDLSLSGACEQLYP